MSDGCYSRVLGVGNSSFVKGWPQALMPGRVWGGSWRGWGPRTWKWSSKPGRPQRTGVVVVDVALHVPVHRVDDRVAGRKEAHQCTVDPQLRVVRLWRCLGRVFANVLFIPHI